LTLDPDSATGLSLLDAQTGLDSGALSQVKLTFASRRTPDDRVVPHAAAIEVSGAMKNVAEWRADAGQERHRDVSA